MSNYHDDAQLLANYHDRVVCNMPTINDIIKKELAFNNFRPKRVPGVSYDTIVAEIGNSLSAAYHERLVVPSGVLICKVNAALSGIQIVDMQQTPVDEFRTLADGRRTFIIYAGSSQPKLATLDTADTAISDDIRLLELSSQTNGIVIKRDQSGVVRIVQDGSLWLIENRSWETKRPLPEHMFLVVECLGLMPSHLYSPLHSLLRLAYYFLSSRNVGTTLVWRIQEPIQRTIQGLSAAGLALGNLNLNINDEAKFPIIEHLLKYHDGAMIIGPTGDIECIGAHLKYGDESVERITADKGTRHTSAKRFSFEHAETVVFVVSQDGPVSIYSDGYKITEMAFDLASHVAAGLKKLVPEKSEDIISHSHNIQCRDCRRQVRIEEVTVVGWKDRETVECPCCNSPDIYSSMCWSLSARPIKFYSVSEE